MIISFFLSVVVVASSACLNLSNILMERAPGAIHVTICQFSCADLLNRISALRWKQLICFMPRYAGASLERILSWKSIAARLLLRDNLHLLERACGGFLG